MVKNRYVTLLVPARTLRGQRGPIWGGLGQSRDRWIRRDGAAWALGGCPGGGTCDKKVAGHRQGWGLVLVGAAAARVTGRSSGGGTARGGDKRRR